MSPLDQTIESIRASSRRLVRELGFTGGDFAGTDLSPSAVHALIEIERGGMTARDLGAVLHLEKSSVSRMLRKLIDAGDVAEGAGGDDGRVKLLSLTPAGSGRVARIHDFARAQVAAALARMTADEAQTVLTGLRLYGDGLAGQAVEPADIDVRPGYRPGAIGRITELHALHYARTSNFGQAFESVVAGGLAEFVNRLGTSGNEIWLALDGARVVGAIAIDGEDMGAGIAHLRWFIVDDAARGRGVGKRLLDAALAFVDARGFAETHLWTFPGLDAARHLYETRGFALAEERPGAQWGREVLEQRFVRASAMTTQRRAGA
ncbi:MAG: helix-turn-helix domain-containing GNAT family N-acetyltransferase [Amaricoccus sp.]|uniref:bifunctional helix-turn-helix transcriptional regulator/GNAT family N-acetyltransferase n=1 Tax=Amaricoccus sp. TaxID=1872485 RepID=UPI0039E219FF